MSLRLDPANNRRYEHRLNLLLTADPTVLGQVYDLHRKIEPGANLTNFHLVPEPHATMVKALIWLDSWGVDIDLFLSFRSTGISARHLLVMFASGLTDDEICVGWDTGTLPGEGILTALAGLRAVSGPQPTTA